jgi:hypothetical protein
MVANHLAIRSLSRGRPQGTGWTTAPTRPASLQAVTSRTGRVSLLIRRCSRFEAAGGRSPRPKMPCGLPCLLPSRRCQRWSCLAGCSGTLGGRCRPTEPCERRFGSTGGSLARSGCCPFAAQDPATSPRRKRPGPRTRSDLRFLVVGATGFEPVTPSVSANHQEPLC